MRIHKDMFFGKIIKQINDLIDRNKSVPLLDAEISRCKEKRLRTLLLVVRAFKSILFSDNPPDSNFRQKLLSRLTSERSVNREPMKSKSFKSSFQGVFQIIQSFFTQHRKTSFAAVSVFLLFVIIFGFFSSWLPRSVNVVPTAYAYDHFSLTPEKSDILGVDPASSFILESRTKVDEDFIREHLVVSPEVEIDIEKENDQRFVITPKSALTKNGQYRFSLVSTAEEKKSGSLLLDYEWAYQVRNVFRTVGTLPAHQSSSVPLNTGIEVYFNTDAWKIEDVEMAFSIEPKVEGHFEKHKRTAVFVPKELVPGKLYTVKILSSLPTMDGSDHLNEEVKFQFETEFPSYGSDLPYFHIYEDELSLNTLEPGVIVFTSNNVDWTKVQMGVFQFSGSDEYLSVLKQRNEFPAWAYYERQRQIIPLDKLTKRFDFQPKVEQFQETTFFTLPEALKSGFYLLQTQIGSQIFQTLIQASDLAAFASVSETKTLVWVNNIKTKAPVGEVTVELIGGEKNFKTGNDGVALFDTPKALLEEKSEKNEFLKVSFAEDVTFVKVARKQEFWWFGTTSLRDRDDYWRYLSLDRPLYQRTDTVQFWGMVKKRGIGEEVKDATLEVVRPDTFDYTTGELRPLMTQALKLSDLGTFIGSFKIENFTAGFYQMNLNVGNSQILSRSFEVATYVKPLYQIKVSMEKDAVFSSEPILALVQTKFYDGTPMSSVSLTYEAVLDNGTPISSGNIISDVGGFATISIPATNISRERWWGDFLFATLTVRPDLPEAGEIAGNAYWKVFPTSYVLRLDQELTDAEAIIRAKIQKIDLVPLNNKSVAEDITRSGEEASYISGPVSGAPVSGKVMKQTWKKVETGETYDFINKQVIKEYYWQSEEAPVFEFLGLTNPDGTYEYRFPYEPNASYRVEVSTVDSENRQNMQEIFLYGRYWKSDESATGFFHQEVKGEDNDMLWRNGEKVSVSLHKGDSLLSKQNTQQYLFYRSKQGILDYRVDVSPVYEFSFDTSLIPNVYVAAAYFNGKYYEMADAQDDGDGWGGFGLVKYDYHEQELSIRMENSQEKYAPGDKATISVHVTDEKNNPVASEVNLSLVDEALFSLRDFYDSNDPLQTLYASVSSGILRTAKSHGEPFLRSGGAEKGGGGGARSNFRDTAYFGTVQTGSDGKGSVTFQLPDNITSFRVTAQTISSKLEAGKSVGRVVISKPIFIEGTLASDYLVSDKPIIQFRAFGNALQPGDEVNYSVKIPSLSFVFEQKGFAFSGIDVAFPELKAGTHEIEFTAMKNGVFDTVKKSFVVLSSRLQKPKKTWYSVNAETKIQQFSQGLVDVLFLQEGRGKYYLPLQELVNAYGRRLDQGISRKLAKQMLETYFQEQLDEDFEDLTSYQESSGGIALLPYGGSDLELTMLVSFVAKDDFDTGGLARYFYSILDDRNILARKQSGETAVLYADTESVSRALAGLLALSEPVLNDLIRFYESADISTLDRFYLLEGMVKFGAKQQAKALYFELMNKVLEQKGNALRVSVGVDQDDVLVATSIASVLGLQFSDVRAPALWKYVDENWTEDLLILLQKIEYLRIILETTARETESAVTLVTNARTEEIKLSAGESRSMTMTSKEAESIKFNNIKGSLGMVVTALDDVSLSELPKDADVNVSRYYSRAGVKKFSFVSTDVVKVTIDVAFGKKAVDGQYELIDFLPSGLRVIGNPSLFLPSANLHSSGTYPLLVEGNRLHFFVGDYDYGRQVTYYVRVVNRGAFTAEPTLLFLQRDPAVGSLSEASAISIE
jgi:hypothetical protein